MPTSNEIMSLKFSMNGSPFCRIIQSGNANNLNYSIDGSPWWGNSITVVGGYNLKVYMGGVWQGKPIKIYIAGVWTIKPLKYFNGSSWV